MIQIHDCAQGTPEWLRARAGVATASEFHTVLAKGRDGGASLTRKTYLYKLAGEIITGEPAENYSNADMKRGHTMEAEARELYAFQHDAEPAIVGFIQNDRIGCSPDALIGDDGLLEIKTKAPHLHIECMLRDGYPPEHRAQCQGALLVTGRRWLDLAIYWPRLPLVVHRVERDEAYIAELAASLDAFNGELDALVARVRSYGSRAAA